MTKLRLVFSVSKPCSIEFEMTNLQNALEQTDLRQLQIYSDRRYLPPDLTYLAFLYPFWGKNSEDWKNPHSRRYDRYLEVGSDLFEISPLEQADAALLPFDWLYVEAQPALLEFAQAMAQAAAEQGIPLIVFYLDDATIGVELDNTLVFRTSAQRSIRRANEVVIPAWSEDFVEHYCDGKVRLRSKSDRPVVGYCGYTAVVKPKNALTNRLRLQLGAVPGAARTLSKLGIELVKPPGAWLYGSRIRSQALFILSKSCKIECNFLIRDALHHTEKLTLTQREQFVENMLGSDYILCTRGGGNFSYRLYETLSCGRIPVLINTDCEMPFERWIDWKHYCVWVEEDDLPHLEQRICEFHDRLTPQQFWELQIECRNLWLEWLSPQGFFANFHRYF